MSLFKQCYRAQFCIAMLVGIVAFAGTTVAFADMQLSSQDISHAIQAQLTLDPGVKSQRVDVETNNGIVTLTGTVNNILARDRAAEIAESVKGVRSVINAIQVKPISRTDREIGSEVEVALLTNPATESWKIESAVEDGVVTLRGEVDSWREKQLAELIAKQVKGIREVRNNLTLAPSPDRSDAEIENEVKAAMRWDVRVDDELVDVDVTNGEVELTGTVGRAAEKTRAIFDAWIRGVHDVDADELSVESWARDPRFRKTKYNFVSDSKIEQAIRDTLKRDPRIGEYEPDLTVEDGVVTLNGTVTTEMAKRAAGQDIRNVVGVFRVKNYLRVRPDHPLQDKEVTDRIETRLLVDPYLESYEIDVATFNGMVRLTGEVDTEFERRRAGDMAALVQGVVDVDNRLVVSSVPADLSTKSDWEITQDIEDELYWSPFVNRSDVHIEVENGVATLTGTVDTWAERIAAQRNAREGGAVSVKNNIQVVNGPEYYKPQS